MYSIREQLLTTCPILASLYMEILHTFSILPQKGLIFSNYVFSQTFTPNLPIFYTDISVISVTFRNSGNDSIQIIVCEQNNELLPLEDAFSSEDKCRQHSYVPEATPWVNCSLIMEHSSLCPSILHSTVWILIHCITFTFCTDKL